MKKVVFLGIGALIALIFIFLYLQTYKKNIISSHTSTTPPINTSVTEQDIPETSVIAEGLEIPWSIAFLPASLDASQGGPTGGMLVTERPGRVRYIDPHGMLFPEAVATIPNVKPIGEGGLLGITLDPDFSRNNYVYLYYTFGGSGNNTLNRVVRMTYKDGKLTDEKTLVDSIPGNSNHNGGRLKFGPDKYLYITTGDAQDPSLAQNPNALAGKVLRVTTNGDPAPGNPFGNRTYSYGHRNPQGIAWDSKNQLWETEHGRSGALSGLDEINVIEPGKNYGWDIIQGNQTKSGMVTPKFNSGNTTWAPAGAVFIENSLFFGGLRGQTLYEAVIENNNVTQVKEHLSGQFGRIRDVVLGPDNMLYITTSNRDGRGKPTRGDDKIIRVNPSKL